MYKTTLLQVGADKEKQPSSDSSKISARSRYKKD